MTADDRVSGLAKGAFPTFPRSQRVRLPTGVEGRDVRPFGVEEESTTEVQLVTANRRHRRIRQPRCLQDRLHRAAQPPESANLNSPAKPSTTTLPRSLNPPSARSPRQCTLCISIGVGVWLGVSVRSGSYGVREGDGSRGRRAVRERRRRLKGVPESAARWCAVAPRCPPVGRRFGPDGLCRDLVPGCRTSAPPSPSTCSGTTTWLTWKSSSSPPGWGRRFPYL